MKTSLQQLAVPVRRLRWRLGAWTTASDQTFHDHLFTPKYDPFTPSYPGYLTIRRFADLAIEKIAGARTLLDLGCGPGEITCELARRLPDAVFIGVDHSSVAIERAREHAARLRLANVTFETANLETFTPASSVDAVLMFDAFHHILNPAAFIGRLRPHTDRFVLIEPAGTWAGAWNRRFDMDWLAVAMLRIRDRLEHQLGVTPEQPPTQITPPPPQAHEPVERRYAASDFLRFFAPWPVELTGTIAGLQEYGPSPFGRSAVRDFLGESLYRMVVDLETTLRRTGRDLCAKHWVVHAAPVGASRVPDFSIDVPPAPEVPVEAAHDARYENYEGPVKAPANGEFQATVDITNKGWKRWTSEGSSPTYLSYRWLDASGQVVVKDGIRNVLPGTLVAGAQRTVPVRVKCPAAAGTYTLALDLVEEGVTWFSDAGVAPLRVPFRVTAR